MKTLTMGSEASRGEQFLSLYSSVAIFLLGAVALVVPSGYSLGSGLLLLGSFSLLFRRPSLALRKEDWLIIAVLLAYMAADILEIWLDGQPSRELDKASRFLFAIPALLLLLAYPPRAAYMWAGLAVGGFATGSWAVWQKLFEGVTRAEGFTNTINFGNLSMLMGVLCLAGLGWAMAQRYPRLWVGILLMGALGGVLGSFLSGSRGGWIGIPFVMLVLYRAYGSYLSGRWLAGILASLFIGAAIVLTTPQLGVQARITQATDQLVDFVEKGNVHSSVGVRLKMWHTAIELIPEKPLLGWGELGYAQARDDLIDQGFVGPWIERYGHVHNDFLDAWLKQGILGLLALLALYLVPLKLFAQRLQSQDLVLRSFAVAGMLLPVAYIDFGLTQVFLAHNSGVMMYAFWLVVLWASMRNYEHVALK
ncbi:O-antigen ligase family protein [Modicisalibacter luteus]|uniref:O-antigen ligase family protein n=1 Tax=Modicisalibacter luteus TaxID=453962 RepID=A0ABV7M3Y8_9GAMM|nr:O-antigen ligase family protein [Halomonas lutea]GHA87941.1 hypothetical protein GCM10007159_06680 [Halomonas lutea]